MEPSTNFLSNITLQRVLYNTDKRFKNGNYLIKASKWI